MTDNINESNEMQTEKIEDTLLSNKELMMNLILENLGKKEKDYLGAKELKLMEKIEKNLISLIEEAPDSIVKEILGEMVEK